MYKKWNRIHSHINTHTMLIKLLNKSTSNYRNNKLVFGVNASSSRNVAKIINTLFYANTRTLNNGVVVKSKLISKQRLFDATRKRFVSYSSNASSSSSKLDDKENNELTVVKSKRLMRLIYARVHPDLYTNHFQAQVS